MCAVQICSLEGFQKDYFPAEEAVVLTMAEGPVFSSWALVFACPPASVMGVNLPSRRTHSGTHLVASKVDGWCLTEQRMSLVVPVSGSLSCQANLRWQACGLAEVSSARCFRCMDTQFIFASF